MNAIDTALKMEQEAVDFYRKCAEKTANPLGKQMFLSIAEDEQHHAACALQMKKDRTFVPAETTPLSDLKQLFDRNRQEMLAQIPSTADDIEAFRTGMRMEKEAIEFYRKAADHAQTDSEKAFFDCLIADEEEHFRIFQNTAEFLEDTGNWFMWEEKGIIEG
ncbi:MAG: ferritin family protein [Thermodesulfovibrionales bacterium]